MAKPVAIIHYQPLELYPPVMNLLMFLAASKCGEVVVYTTCNRYIKTPLFTIESRLIIIKRLAASGKDLKPLRRYLQYVQFYLLCFFELIKTGPAKVLYFETLSSFPVYLYKKFIGKKAEVFAHYHEYTSPEEYNFGMRLTRFFHKKEQWLYPRTVWLSHTNSDRLNRFVDDEKLASLENGYIMPNYPGRNWHVQPLEKRNKPVRIVYVGAVSRETMHFNDFVDWLIGLNGIFSLDIYSFNISPADADWINQMESPLITLHPAVDYYSLPGILKDYDIGVILYKGHIPNYVLNAPNKLFEYHACGLDVWVPIEMTGCKPFFTKYTYPKILPVDFQELSSFEWTNAISRTALQYKPSSWYYEQIYPEIATQLFNR